MAFIYAGIFPLSLSSPCDASQKNAVETLHKIERSIDFSKAQGWRDHLSATKSVISLSSKAFRNFRIFFKAVCFLFVFLYDQQEIGKKFHRINIFKFWLPCSRLDKKKLRKSLFFSIALLIVIRDDVSSAVYFIALNRVVQILN